MSVALPRVNVCEELQATRNKREPMASKIDISGFIFSPFVTLHTAAIIDQEGVYSSRDKGIDNVIFPQTTGDLSRVCSASGGIEDQLGGLDRALSITISLRCRTVGLLKEQHRFVSLCRRFPFVLPKRLAFISAYDSVFSTQSDPAFSARRHMRMVVNYALPAG